MDSPMTIVLSLIGAAWLAIALMLVGGAVVTLVRLARAVWRLSMMAKR